MPTKALAKAASPLGFRLGIGFRVLGIYDYCELLKKLNRKGLAA